MVPRESSRRGRARPISRRRSASAWPKTPLWRSSTAKSATCRTRCPMVPGSRSSRPRATGASSLSATRRRTCSPRRCWPCFRARPMPSGHRSRMASTTTSSCPTAPPSVPTISTASKPRCARSSRPISPSNAVRCRRPKDSSCSAIIRTSARSSSGSTRPTQQRSRATAR